MVPFSQRTAWNRSPAETATGGHDHLLDLTVSNPTTAGLDLASVLSIDRLAEPGTMVYAPDARGLLTAREAVCRYYGTHQAVVMPDQILLTSSTSESYTHLFRLLCDPGDEVLIAQPSYPLFEYLADLADVRLRTFPLFLDHGWHVDRAALEGAITPRTRALILVHPNNPTGHATSALERDYLRLLCARHSLALVVDEVFLDYPLNTEHRITSFAAEPSPVLTFVLSGLSKIAALPQMKVGWIVTLGPTPMCAEASARLEIIADTFLSVNSPAQHALGTWMEQAPLVQGLILGRVRAGVEVLREYGMDILPVEAGWSGILRLARTYEAADAATALLEAGVATHSGAFFGMPETNRVVVSLLTPHATLAEAAQRMQALRLV